MNPNIKHLKVFLQLAKSGSFISGALRSNISQPSLSRTIRLLEAELGTRLFDRDTRGSMLTPAGAELVGVAERILQNTQAELSSFDRFVNGDRGRITVMALPSLSALLLPAAILTSREKFPEVQIFVREGPAEEVEAAVLSGAVDIGLSLKPLEDDLFKWQPLLSDQLGLVARSDDVLAAQTNCSWNVLQERPFVSHVTSTNVCKYLTSALRTAEIAAEPVFMCTEISTAGVFVASGMGIALLPRLCLPLTGRSDLIWRPLTDPVPVRRLGAITRAQANQSKTIRAFSRQLQLAAATVPK